MASTFFDGIDHLAEQIGYGTISAKVEVDQVYAHYQEVGDDFAHPEGGKARYLRDSLYEGSDKRMENVARSAITTEGSNIRGGMKDAAESLSDDVYANAPLEFGDLKGSGHPTVTDDGAIIFDRAPHVGRLSESELRAKSRTRSLFHFDRRR